MQNKDFKAMKQLFYVGMFKNFFTSIDLKLPVDVSETI